MKSFIITTITILTITIMFGLFKNLFTQGVNNEELTKIISDKAYLVDVRTPQEFASGSVKGAINIPLDVIQNKLSMFKGKSAIVVFCRSGNRSGQAQTILMQNGIENVHNGGTWQNVNELLNAK
jgi:rhodanese-related sulfurtransferase